MRPLMLVLALFVPFSVVTLDAQSATPSINLPDIPDISTNNTFYYLRVLTAFVGSRKVLVDDEHPITVRFALKLIVDEEHVTIVIRNADNYRDCERLESNKLDHHDTHRGRRHHAAFQDKIRNAKGQVFDFYWHSDPTDGHHELYQFKIHTPESTRELPIYFMALTSDNPRSDSPSQQKKLAAEYFSGTNPNCE